MIVKGQRNLYLSFYLRVQMFRMETPNESCAFSFLLKQKKPQENQKIQSSLFPTVKTRQGDFTTKKYFKNGGKLQ